jgi:hypothetical protein
MTVAVGDKVGDRNAQPIFCPRYIGPPTLIVRSLFFLFLLQCPVNRKERGWRHRLTVFLEWRQTQIKRLVRQPTHYPAWYCVRSERT